LRVRLELVAVSIFLTACSGLALEESKALNSAPANETDRSIANTKTSQGEVSVAFTDADIRDVVKSYADLSKQKIILGSEVKGKITIISSHPVNSDVFFQLLSSALATQGFAFIRQDDVLILKFARSAMRSMLEVSTELPALKPERMVTYIYRLKNLKADQVFKDLRILVSKDGEMAAMPGDKQLVFTDWVSNIHRIDKILRALDQSPKKEKMKM
jgi:general secretion pathway protein D